MIWSKEETMTRVEIEAIQLERLKETVTRMYEKNHPYREKMIEANIKPEDIKTLDDLKRLPFTTKDDLRKNYPFGFITAPREDIVRIHASSGTTGKPTVVGYTQKDLDTWTELVTRIAVMGGASKTDLAQICFGYGMFTGALGLHYGLENLGAVVAPASSGNTEKQIMYMKDFETTLLVATPSYALHIAEAARSMGIDPAKELKVKIGLFGGEGMTESMRDEMHRLWGENMKATQNYGMSELMGPGISGECLELRGMHVMEDNFIPEIIDSETGEVLAEGEEGELVVSCINKEGFPIIRYRTKDISKLYYEPCPCGRTMARMANIIGRADDMLLIRGVNVFPSQIEEVLLKIEGIGPHYEIIVRRENHLDSLEVKVELGDDSKLELYGQLHELEKEITSKLRTVLGLTASVKLVAPNSLKRFEGKAKRVTDLR